MDEWCKGCWTEHRSQCDHDVEHCKKIMAELYDHFQTEGEDTTYDDKRPQ